MSTKTKKDPLEPFSDLVLDRMQPILTQWAKTSGVTDAEVSGLSHSKPNIQEKKRSSSSYEQYWEQWLRILIELYPSLETLDHSAVYLPNFPRKQNYRFHKINEATWLRYHTEMHLHEVYVLYNRLITFIKKVQRLAKQHKDTSGETTAQELHRSVQRTFDAIVSARGSHVHTKRFSDSDLYELEGLILLTSTGKMKKFRPARRIKTFLTVAKLEKQLKKNNKDIKLVCSVVSEKMTPIIKRHEPKQPKKTKRRIRK